ncbi:hypothetical protein GCM10022233_68390 [Streptomyces shaanxiensis]|uniref:Uncharacterized protein n=1 Tax=Streptomyces shaanxiensis TaxID=653357 RepID=A0ABP7W2J1_9ACTN
MGCQQCELERLRKVCLLDHVSEAEARAAEPTGAGRVGRRSPVTQVVEPDRRRRADGAPGKVPRLPGRRPVRDPIAAPSAVAVPARPDGRSGTVAPPNGRTLGGTWLRRRGRVLQRAGRRVERHMERAAR